MARYLLIFSFLLMGLVSATAQSALSGKVTDADTGEPILFGDVVIYRNGGLVTGGQTDFDGNYIISPMDPGTYDVVFKYVGYADQKVEGVRVDPDKETNLDASLSSGLLLDAVEVISYKNPLVEQDNTTQGASLSSKDIANLPSKNINGIISQVAGAGSADEGDAVSIRGSRSDGTFYYIDGIRVSGNLIPQSEIENLQVITGGIGAKYGDVTGGVISITTKGPSAKFGGGFDAETSKFLDPYGYNLISAYINGPIIKNKDGNALLGYRISGQYRYLEDDDPAATDIYRINDAALERLQANPVLQTGPAADFLTEEDVDILDVQPFEQNERLDLTAKLDARLSDAIDIAFTGTYSGETDFFTPGEAETSGTNWRLLNAHNNPFTDETRYRGNFRLRHRLGKAAAGSPADADNAEAAKGSAIRNASYTIQAGLEQFDYKLGDPTHGDNLFDYGYVGSFDKQYVPNIIIGEDENDIPFAIQEGYREIDGENGFTAGDINPVLANYNLLDSENLDALPAQNGRTSDLFTDSYNFHSNVGSVYNRYRIRDEQTLTLQANAGFDLLPGGSENGKHSIEFGFLYEQRTNRFYEMLPRELWTVARQEANDGLSGTDPDGNPLGTWYVNPNNTSEISQEQQAVDWLPFELSGAGGGVLGNDDFFENVRELTGANQYTNVNVDALTPDQLALEMFTAAELNGQSRLDFNYYGYDYLGNDFNGTFEDFFTREDEAGNLTRPVAPFRPTYTAAYIQDKFKFRDIIIRAGLRLDSYDANTKVLKDPYSLYELQQAGDFAANNGYTLPGTIGDDFSVYVSDNQESNSVTGYRDGDTWYFPNGTQANSPTEVFGTNVAPGKRITEDLDIDIANNFGVDEINKSFEDYKPQVNLMPRLAFSFPISEEANFFAHYDILVQRPPNNNVASPYEYLNFNSRNFGSANSPKANANLKPEKTIDYEVGFQQKISNSSSLKIAAYYKELRDMIQIRIYQNIDVISNYFTYDNLDFGTVKGFSFQYDLRRTGNVSLKASYTLQFADGTGSDANSSRGLGSNEIQRALYPLSFDERHRINLNFDYRYASGKKYNGPELFGKQIFANAGANVQVIAVSGRPYTAKTTPEELGGSQTKGSINGSRLPWRNTINLRVDKDFTLREAKEGNNGLNLNIYFRVSNLLDTRNIINVYSATGSPTTDGFRESSRGLAQAERQNSTLSYLNSYQWRVTNPNFLSLPRRMYIGARVDF